jgi:hypothetical protein
MPILLTYAMIEGRRSAFQIKWNSSSVRSLIQFFLFSSQNLASWIPYRPLPGEQALSNDMNPSLENEYNIPQQLCISLPDSFLPRHHCVWFCLRLRQLRRVACRKLQPDLRRIKSDKRVEVVQSGG